MITQRRVKILPGEVARKIAAGEVIDRPNAILRELMDNAVDSGATRIDVDITCGGIEKIRVVDNGCGMSREDLAECAHPHATSKISTEDDLLNLNTLGFRGEALSSMAAVSRLEITSGGFKMRASVTEDHVITPCVETKGTIVQTQGLFENFPARRQFLKRPASEATMCRSTFEEKAMARPDIAFSFTSDGEEKIILNAGQSLKERFVETMGYFENQELFYEVNYSHPDGSFSFTLVTGEPAVSRPSRKDIFIYVNGRRIQEYSLVQAIVYGSQGYFPNGTFPVACLFVTMNPSLVDFNIHPAKKEARFRDMNTLHHQVSTAARNFFKQYTVRSILESDFNSEEKTQNLEFNFSASRHHLEQTASLAFNSPSYSELPKERYSIKNPSASFAEKKEGRAKFFPSPAEPAFNPSMESDRQLKPNYVPEIITTGEQKHEDGFHFTGLALGTFLIAEKDGTLYIIDQHAAHERMIYDQIMAESQAKQKLMVPYEITTDSQADDNYIEAIKPKLEEAGYTCENCGNGKWMFTTVPARFRGTAEDLKKDVLDRRVNPKDMINAVAASTACRSAVMDGTVLDRITAEEIARGALKLPDPHCPHGRPVFTTITRKQLFALVKRT